MRGLSLKRHKDIGARLGLIRDTLIPIGCEVSKAYSDEERDKILRIVELIDEVRSDFEKKLSKEHADLSDDEISDIYFGTLSGRRKGVA